MKIFGYGKRGQQKLFCGLRVTGSDGNIYTCMRSHTSASTNKPIAGAIGQHIGN